jgi:hypothetical protein
MALFLGGHSLGPHWAAGACHPGRQTTGRTLAHRTGEKLVLADLAADNRQAGPREHEFGRALRVASIWLLGAMYFCLISANQTIPFWLPSIIQGLGVKNALTIGMLLAWPYIAAMIAMVLVGRHSDRTLERRYHAALPCLSCAPGSIYSRRARFWRSSLLS